MCFSPEDQLKNATFPAPAPQKGLLQSSAGSVQSEKGEHRCCNLVGEQLETVGGQGGQDILEEVGGGVDVHHEHHVRVQKEVQLVHVVICPNRHI